MPFLGGVTALMGPHAMTVRLGAQSPWTNAAWYNHLTWDGVEFTLSLSGGKEDYGADRHVPVEKIRVLRGILQSMRVEGEKPLSPDLKGLESGVQEPSGQRAHNAHGYALLGGALRSMAPSEPDNHDHRLAPEKPLSLMWYDPRYLGYKTSTVASKTSLKQVDGVGRLTDGGIGTHMILWDRRGIRRCDHEA
jgi:hypothetical protein